MRFVRMYEAADALPVPFERLDITDAHVCDAFMSESEREVVLALVAAASQAVRWVGLDRDGLVAWAKAARMRRILRAPLTLFAELDEEPERRVAAAVRALRDRGCVKIYGSVVTPLPALVTRLVDACMRAPEPP